jgi:hypothetical protein
MTHQFEEISERAAQKEQQHQSVDRISQHCPGKDMCFVAVDLERNGTEKEKK